MAKITLAKLGLKKPNIESKEIKFNDCLLQIVTYLPIEKKLNLISNVLNMVIDDNKFYNPGKITIALTIEVLKEYAGIEFTDKQLENPWNLYDLIHTSGLDKIIIEAIPTEEYSFLEQLVWDTIESIYKYNNSLFGILDNVNQDYQNLDLDITKLQKEMADPNNLTLLKDVVTKLG